MNKFQFPTVDYPNELEADIYIYDLVNNIDTPLIQTAFWEQQPDWSKYNDIITYDSYRNSLTDLYKKPVVGGAEFCITSQGPHYDYRPNWCFEDTKILFYMEVVNGQLWIINSTGGTAMQLTFSPGLKFDPDISSDDVMVVYCKDNYGNYDIYSCPFAELGQIDVVPTSLGNIKALYAGEQPAKASPPPAVEAEPPRGGLPVMPYH